MSSNNVVDTLLSSFVPGLGNLPGTTAVASIPSQSVPNLASVAWSTSAPLTVANSIAEARVQFLGVNSNWFLINGIFSYSNPSPFYTIGVVMSFDASNVYFSGQIINFSGGTITLPAITMNFNVFLYTAPW